MKLSVQISILQQAAQLVGAVIPSRSNREVLQNMKLVADDRGLTLMGSDQEVAIRRTLVAVTVEEPGEILVPSARFQAILRELGGERMSMTTDGLLIDFVSDTGVFKLYGMDSGEYPSFPEFDPDGFIEMNPESLGRSIENVEIAVAKDLGRYAVNGVLIEMNEGGVNLAATDGRRLAFSHKPLGSPPSDPAEVIVSSKGASLFRRSLISDPDEELIGVRAESGIAVIRTSTTQITARAIEGKFPAYQKLLNRELPYRATVETSELHAAARKASIMAGSDIRVMHMIFGQDTIEVTSRDEGSGEVRTQLSAEHDAPSGTEVYVNPDFLLDFFKLALPPQLTFRFGGLRFPLIFQPSEEFTYLVSPVTTE